MASGGQSPWRYLPHRPRSSFPQRVWHIVASIPEGYVTTYGEVARLAGSPRA
ncbi:hypothetical protein C7D74_08800, partial [Klebsiella pneumoniae]